MKLLLLAIAIIHVAALVLLFIATIDNAWWYNSNVQNATSQSVDLWKKCNYVDNQWICGSNGHDVPLSDWIQAVQAFMILSVIFCSASLIIFTAQLFRLEKGGMFHFTGAFQLLACLCVMVAASMYAAQFNYTTSGGYGYCFILAWIAFPLTLISGVLYCILRKK
ncbi:peripheral myelin protein 22-like [Lethenteron reissneri]|uniref:peripheral myelin protein 22-like n=1 Tax=Lethenteron reissneri TaxID=7753 RepID=UPI002AB627E0|nr:peripheral myelin protein 22-like [Lethenteron reissneri]XP_061405540.1 peripheral myelin protein 22-like [Lethenteron reissneri]